MMSIRVHQWVHSSADAAWAVVSDSSRLPDWFPGIETCEVENGERTCVLRGGARVVERIVTNDAMARRFQYEVVTGMDVTHHLGTVDVIDDDRGGCLVVYGTDVDPDGLGPVMRRSMTDALSELASVVAS